jgi:hypothetical protein
VERKYLTDEKRTEPSALPIKLIIKRKGFRISTEGTISAIDKELDALAEFADKVAEKVGLPEEPSTEPEPESALTPEDVAQVSISDIPSIKPSKRTIESLESLFSTPWGRTPRSVAEVKKALEVNAIYDSVSSVNVYLTRLVQRGKLRRIEKEGKWVYFKIPE